MVHALAVAVLAPNFVFHCIHRSRLGKVQNQRLGKVNGQKGQRMAAEMESGRQVQRKGKALEKVHALENAEPNPSSLATRLLHLWGSGLLSATMIRELASLAMEDGASHPELIKLAESGNWGAQPGNIHKQVMKKFVPM